MKLYLMHHRDRRNQHGVGGWYTLDIINTPTAEPTLEELKAALTTMATRTVLAGWLAQDTTVFLLTGDYPEYIARNLKGNRWYPAKEYL